MVCGHGPSIGRETKKAAKKIERETKRAAPDILTGGITAGIRETAKFLTPDMPDIMIDNGGANAPQYVMPDAEELRRARRRRGVAAGSGRSSTILSGDQSTRLGG